MVDKKNLPVRIPTDDGTSANLVMPSIVDSAPDGARISHSWKTNAPPPGILGHIATSIRSVEPFDLGWFLSCREHGERSISWDDAGEVKIVFIVRCPEVRS